MAKIVVFAGSARKDSFNKKLAKVAHQKLVANGADADFIDLADYPMPIYDGDLEAGDGLPENARKLKEIFDAADGFLIVSPEYNSSFPPLLKNVIDWCSRPEGEGDFMLKVFSGKIAAIAGASPGGFGGMRALVPLRMLLGNIAMNVIPNQLAVSGVHEKFAEDGTISDDGTNMSLDFLVQALKDTTEKLRG